MMTRIRRYILVKRGNSRVITAAPDVMVWARWFETAGESRIVAKTQLPNDVRVSTVFLGLDHRFSLVGPPILFETMVFGGKFDGDMERYATWAAAEKGHKRMVEKVQDPGVVATKRYIDLEGT